MEMNGWRSCNVFYRNVADGFVSEVMARRFIMDMARAVLAGICGLFVGLGTPGQADEATANNAVRSYPVNKKVADFPEREDMSTPEAAYATLNRLSASGEQSFWPRLSIRKLGERMSPGQGKREVSEEAKREWLNAEILEVHIFEGRCAGVLARVPHPSRTIIDYRGLEFEDGRWLNAGNSVFGSLEEARAGFQEACDYWAGRPKRGPVADPPGHLKPFVDFLKEQGREPKALLLEALAGHRIVIIGEVHHRPLYWAFNADLVKDPGFPRHVGTIYLELPSNDQDKIDRFLAAQECDTLPVIETLRDMLWMGWPDRAMLDFFVAVWQVNQDLASDQRLRIRLVDMARPWDKIQTREDWRKYDCDRDQFMAENILQDVRQSPAGARHGLFIVGVGHTGLGLTHFQGRPEKTAGWYLVQDLGRDKVFAVFPHRCVLANMGRVDGRLALGLFDSAFAEVQDKPVAFTLREGPFGQQPYDSDPDAVFFCQYKDGFDAYLYLGPLETEVFSPLIEGFYTDAFVQELERRYKIMFGKGWAEAYRQDKSDAAHFIAWMSTSWGQPRDWKNRLGPRDAWHYGDDWEKEIQARELNAALQHPEQIKAAARRLFDAIRAADYQRHAGGAEWDHFLPPDLDYQVNHYFDVWVMWVCRTFKDNPIRSLDLGEVFRNGQGLPTVPYEVTLANGRVLQGNLPFTYVAKQGYWMGTEGLDWHLQYPLDNKK
jgi:hypothetical protein